MRRQRLGVALRVLRERRGLSAEAVGNRLGWSASKISRIETARIGVRASDVRKLLEIYRADERMSEELLALAYEAAKLGWWEQYPEIQQSALSEYIALEDEASQLLTLQRDIVPGLLQSAEYAEHLINGWTGIIPLPPRTTAARLEVRLRRRQLIYPPRSLPMNVVLDEAVLLSRVGTAATRAAQLDRLAELAQLPNIALRILPLDGEHGPGIASFILLDFAPAFDMRFPAIVHTESITAVHAQDESITHEYRLAHEWLTHQSLDEARSLERLAEAAHGWRAASASH